MVGLLLIGSMVSDVCSDPRLTCRRPATHRRHASSSSALTCVVPPTPMPPSLRIMLLAHELLGPVDAPAVVLIHGITQNRQTWRPVADALSATHRVLLVDLRGHG